MSGGFWAFVVIGMVVVVVLRAFLGVNKPGARDGRARRTGGAMGDEAKDGKPPAPPS